MKDSKQNSKVLYQYLYQFMGKKKIPYLSLNILCLLYESVFVFVYSYMYKMFFNSVEYHQIVLFEHACVLCIVVFAAEYASVYLYYFKMKQVRVIVFDVKMQMFHKLTHMGMNYFEEHHSGDTLKRLNWDANVLKDFYFGGIYRVALPICTGIVSLITMILYNWKLSICSILFSIITVELSLMINKVIKSQNKEIQKNLSKLSERLSDLLSGFLIIKMFSGAELVTKHYLEENKAVKELTVKRARVLSNMEMLTFLTGMLGSFGTIAVGIYLVTKGELDYGTIMAIVTLQLSICGILQRFGGAVSGLTWLLSCAQRVIDFLGLEEEKQSYLSSNLKPDVTADGIEIEHLTFFYDSEKNKNAALNDVNLKVALGERIMIVGESGCGKSTLLKLLMGFYEKSAGSIKIFGHLIEEYSPEQLRGLITYVPQESYLFEGTIEENIRYGKMDATKEQIIVAANMAYASTFIENFSDGYDTKLTAGGNNLSGGQRQRVAIARAFLKDAPIILLDEPSSALDVESEGMINKAMKELMKGKIVLMVTHRTNSFQDFDRVIQI